MPVVRLPRKIGKLEWHISPHEDLIMNLPLRVTSFAFLFSWGLAVSAHEVRSRGPIHEAFAQPAEPRAQPTQAVPKAPPGPIVELLPEQRPEGENIRWIPGYWGWDAERGDFTWVSGVFRQAPPERQFVPGSWTKSDEAWRWVPGFWADIKAKEIAYLPEPPASVERGPDGEAPNSDSVYHPGYWRFGDNRFDWQAGTWEPAVDGRVWVSPRYQWTPSGYLFIDGYRDYPLANRGQLFAPAVLDNRVFQPGGNFRPTYALGLDTILANLFTRPGSYQYSFGDYFDSSFASLGYQPWYAGAGRRDPLLGYYQWANRTEPNWFANVQQAYQDRATGKRPAPLQILEAQKEGKAELIIPAGLGQEAPNVAAAQNLAASPFNPLLNPNNPFANPFANPFGNPYGNPNGNQAMSGGSGGMPLFGGGFGGLPLTGSSGQGTSARGGGSTNPSLPATGATSAGTTKTSGPTTLPQLSAQPATPKPASSLALPKATAMARSPRIVNALGVPITAAATGPRVVPGSVTTTTATRAATIARTGRVGTAQRTAPVCHMPAVTHYQPPVFHHAPVMHHAGAAHGGHRR
jgi:hypothetical protein